MNWLALYSVILFSIIVSFLFKELPLGCWTVKDKGWGRRTNTKDCCKGRNKIYYRCFLKWSYPTTGGGASPRLQKLSNKKLNVRYRLQLFWIVDQWGSIDTFKHGLLPLLLTPLQNLMVRQFCYRHHTLES